MLAGQLFDSVRSNTMSESIQVLRGRIAAQRASLIDQCRSIAPSAKSDRSRPGITALTVAGLVVAGFVLMASPRARKLARASVASGWIAWRALSLFRQVVQDPRNT